MQKTVSKHARNWWALVLLSASLPPFTLNAQTLWSDTTGSHLWADAANWSNGLPGTGVEARFEGAGGRIELDRNVTNAFGSLTFSASDKAYVLTSADTNVYSLTGPAGAGSISVAREASGSQLTIDKASLRANAGSSFAYNGSDNTLTITGAGSKLETAYNSGFSIGSGDGSVAINSGNTLTVKDGGTLTVGLLAVGGKGADNVITITGTGSTLSLVAGSGQTNFHLNIGNATAAATNRVHLLDGGTASISNWGTNLIGGSLTIGRGSSLTHTNHATRTQNVQIGNKGTLYGAGTLVATRVQAGTFAGSTGSGAQIHIGESASDFGAFNVTGDWLNADLTITLQIGDLRTSPTAGTHYDYLALTGAFTYGGSVVIDLATAQFPGDLNELRLIGWTSATGSSSDLNVRFINGGPLDVSFRSDGLYVTPIPEPGTASLLIGLGLGMSALTFHRRWRR